MAISNIFINNLLHEKSFFKGVYSANEEKPMLSDNECIILNLSDKNEKGTHFISVCKKRNKIILFDPIKIFEVIPQSIINYIKKHNAKIVTNNQAIQDYSSDYCGYFCIAFVLLCNSLNILEFTDLFYTDKNLLVLNDVIVLKIIYKIMNK
jgi:hypothetical protein